MRGAIQISIIGLVIAVCACHRQPRRPSGPLAPLDMDLCALSKIIDPGVAAPRAGPELAAILRPQDRVEGLKLLSAVYGGHEFEPDVETERLRALLEHAPPADHMPLLRQLSALAQVRACVFQARALTVLRYLALGRAIPSGRYWPRPLPEVIARLQATRPSSERVIATALLLQRRLDELEPVWKSFDPRLDRSRERGLLDEARDIVRDAIAGEWSDLRFYVCPLSDVPNACDPEEPRPPVVVEFFPYYWENLFAAYDAPDGPIY